MYRVDDESGLRPHQRLQVWRDAMDLVEAVYKSTAAFPNSERFGLQAQMRRAAVSIPSNIAEGAGRISRLEYVRFLGIARGSLSELDTQLHLARRLNLLSDDAARGMVDRCFVRLNALLKSLKQSDGKISEPETEPETAELAESPIPTP